jgi:hypothetical protein
MKSPLMSYLLPGLIVGAVGGYALSTFSHKSHTVGKSSTPRETFLSDEADAIDYEKLARVCLAVHQRTDSPTLVNVQSPPALESPEQVKKTKEYLDRLMANALERGAWSRMSSFRARQLLGDLPASDAADFAQLFATAVKQGDLSIAPGAWVPETIN